MEINDKYGRKSWLITDFCRFHEALTNSNISGVHQYALTTEGAGELVLILINYDHVAHNVDTDNKKVKSFKVKTVFEVTSDDLQSSKVMINGRLASFPADAQQTPNALTYALDKPNEWPLKIPPLSYSFFKFHNGKNGPNDTV